MAHPRNEQYRYEAVKVQDGLWLVKRFMGNRKAKRRRYWLSWVQPTKDYRPLKDPPNEAVFAWWCSGYDSNDMATLCAGVRANTERAAIKAIIKDWPEAKEATWRFIQQMEPPFQLSDRFPLEGWAKERWESRP